MTDPLTWSINLGLWAGVRVRVHILLVLFALGKLLESAWINAPSRPHPFLETIAWLGLLALALAAKEIVAVGMSNRLGVDRDEVRVWPLGHLGSPALSAAERSPEGVMFVMAGLMTSLSLALAIAVGLRFAGVQMVFNPFGNVGTGGAPFLSATVAASPFTVAWWIGWFGYINWVLFVANLIPALPLDMGRIYRAFMAARSRDGMIGPWTAHSCAAILAVVGLFRWLYFKKPGGGELLSLALLIEFVVRMEARMLDEGSFFDDGVFGYDFSQGYTSLEAGAATIRTPREGALKRWRRRRSDVRQRRKEAEEAAEEQKMDGILEKLHREGRSSLSEEEQRFLVRVSAKYKKRVRGS